MEPRVAFLTSLVVFLFWVTNVKGTPGYYRSYTVFGTGDNIIATLQAHGGAGPEAANRKWNVECLDGEAVIGILDAFNDFTSIGSVWCKFMMPYKPPTNGIYPFYPNCFSKNFTTQFFCYTPRFHEPSVDSFMTAFYDNEFSFNVYRPYVDDSSPYKCCKAPTGYYIDYGSCYYMPTHDQFWEYYDSPIQLSGGYFLIYCATGYVMTGLAKKAHPITQEYHIEWIQCCRLGFGPREKLLPVRLPRLPPVVSSYGYGSNTVPVQSSYSGGVPSQAYANNGYSAAGEANNLTRTLSGAGLFDGTAAQAKTVLGDVNGIPINLDKNNLAINPQKPIVKS